MVALSMTFSLLLLSDELLRARDAFRSLSPLPTHGANLLPDSLHPIFMVDLGFCCCSVVSFVTQSLIRAACISTEGKLFAGQR